MDETNKEYIKRLTDISVMIIKIFTDHNVKEEEVCAVLTRLLCSFLATFPDRQLSNSMIRDSIQALREEIKP